MTSKRSFLPLAAALCIGAASQSQAAIIIVAPTATTAGSLQITSPITFTVTVAGSANFVVLDELVSSSDGSRNQFPLTPRFSYSLNGGSPVSSLAAQVVDNGFASNAVTERDFVIFFDGGSSTAVAMGDTFTLLPGTFTIVAGADFNPRTTGTFTGEAFLATNGGVRRSANTPVGAVPEPGSAALGALAGLTLLRRRRR